MKHIMLAVLTTALIGAPAYAQTTTPLPVGYTDVVDMGYGQYGNNECGYYQRFYDYTLPKFNYSFEEELSVINVTAGGNDPIFDVCVDGICQTYAGPGLDYIVVHNYDLDYSNVELTVQNSSTASNSIFVCGAEVYNMPQAVAQVPTNTPTPTPLPTTTPAATPIVDDLNVLYPGFYESSNGNLRWAGDWFTGLCGGNCQQDDELIYTDANATLHVRFYGDGLTIARLIGPEHGQMEMCFNGLCSLVDNFDPGAMQSSDHTTLLRPGYYHAVIRNASVTGARLSVDAITIHDDSQTYTVPTPTALPTATPDYTLVENEFTLGGEAYRGTYTLSMTAGDVSISILLSAIAVLLLVSVVLWLWKR